MKSEKANFISPDHGCQPPCFQCQKKESNVTSEKVDWAEMEAEELWQHFHKALFIERLRAAYEKGATDRQKMDAEICEQWRVFYNRMQEKSNPGEKDGMHRAFAAEDIKKEILSAKIEKK